MIFHHFVSWARMSNAVLFTTAAFVCPCWPLLIWFLVFGLAYTALALYTVKFGPKAEYFAMKDKLLYIMIGFFGVLYTVYTVALLLPSDEFATFLAEMEEGHVMPPPAVNVLIGWSLFQALFQLPPLIVPGKALEGYMGDDYKSADRYLKAQLEGYMCLNSAQWFCFQLGAAGLLFMTPHLFPVLVVNIVLSLYAVVLFSHNVVNAAKYGFVVAGMLPWLVLLSITLGIAIAEAMSIDY